MRRSGPGGCSEAADVTFTIRPHPASTILGAKARQVRYGPTRSTMIVSTQRAGSVRVSGATVHLIP